MPVLFHGEKVSEPARDKLKEALKWLEEFVKPSGFMAGTSSMTLADISIYAFYSTLETTKDVLVNLNDYPSLEAWSAKMKGLIPNYEKANQEGVQVFADFFKARSGLL